MAQINSKIYSLLIQHTAMSNNNTTKLNTLYQSKYTLHTIRWDKLWNVPGEYYITRISFRVWHT